MFKSTPYNGVGFIFLTLNYTKAYLFVKENRVKKSKVFSMLLLTEQK